MFNSLENIGTIAANESSNSKVTENDFKILTPTVNEIQYNQEKVKYWDSENESSPQRKKQRRPSESLAERAKSISRSQLKKLRSTLSVEDLAKYVPGFQQSGYDSDNTSESANRFNIFGRFYIIVEIYSISSAWSLHKYEGKVKKPVRDKFCSFRKSFHRNVSFLNVCS